jgi:hypothetical protein
MRIYLPFSKRDKNAEGQEWTIKEMQKLCPVNVMLDCKVARLAQEGRTSVCESGPLGTRKFGSSTYKQCDEINALYSAPRGLDAGIFSTYSLGLDLLTMLLAIKQMHEN